VRFGVPGAAGDTPTRVHDAADRPPPGLSPVLLVDTGQIRAPRAPSAYSPEFARRELGCETKPVETIRLLLGHMQISSA
jgi:hypothetical protein